MGLEIGRIDHDGLVLCSFRHSQALHHLDKDALVAPAFPAVIQGLRRTIFPRRITPPEAVAIDENDAAQDTPIIDADSGNSPDGVPIKNRTPFRHEAGRDSDK